MKKVCTKMIATYPADWDCQKCIHLPETCNGKLIAYNDMADHDYQAEVNYWKEKGKLEEKYIALARIYEDLHQAWLTLKNS